MPDAADRVQPNDDEAASNYDIRHFDLTDAVREAFESGCECDSCNILRALARTNALQHRRFSWLRSAAYAGAAFGFLSFCLILLDLLWLHNP